MTIPPTTGYSFGDIVLVSFPFTDQSATKRRPAVIVSAERYNRERPEPHHHGGHEPRRGRQAHSAKCG